MEKSIFDRKIRRISPTGMMFAWYFSLVLAGAFLLWLPWSQNKPEAGIDFVSALFTAASSASVTGLAVVNIHDTFSRFGQFVILLLIEFGGVGVMTFASFGFRLLGRRLSLSQQAATADGIYQNDAATEFKRTFTQIFRLALIIQLAGAVLIAVSLLPLHGEKGEYALLIWSAVFHSASAFCNCGLTIYRDDILSLADNPLFIATLLALIILGGLGHLVLNELSRLPGHIRRHSKKPFWISLHTRVVLATTACILVAGVAGMRLLGTGGGESSFWRAVFQTIASRSAGFSVVPQSSLPLPSAILVALIMFVGGSPGSCAGGIKTTSLALWIGRIRGNFRNERNTNLFGFTIAPELVDNARILIAAAILWNVLSVFALSIAHPEENLATLVYEQISAFGTVGLSMEFTPRLNTFARLWIIASMLVGKLGLLSIALLVRPASKSSINRPIGRIMVG